MLGLANSGNGNSGNWNSGNGNSGFANSGNWNSGEWNSGNGNSGFANSGNHHAGFFCTGEAKMSLFNRPTDLTYDEVVGLLPSINIYPCKWVSEDAMSDMEKDEHREYLTTGGYLKTLTLREAWQEWWAGATESDKEKILALPNFDADIFQEITGIDVRCGE